MIILFHKPHPYRRLLHFPENKTKNLHETIKKSLKVLKKRIWKIYVNHELLILNEKHIDALIETKTKRRETVEFELNKQMGTFSFPSPIIFSEEGL